MFTDGSVPQSRAAHRRAACVERKRVVNAGQLDAGDKRGGVTYLMSSINQPVLQEESEAGHAQLL